LSPSFYPSIMFLYPGHRRGSLFLLIIILLTFIGVGHWDAFFVVARQPPFQCSHLLFPISHHVLHLLLCPGRRSGPACWFKPSVSSSLSNGSSPTAAKWPPLPTRPSSSDPWSTSSSAQSRPGSPYARSFPAPASTPPSEHKAIQPSTRSRLPTSVRISSAAL